MGPIRPVAIILSDKGDRTANRTVRLAEMAEVYDERASTGRCFWAALTCADG